MTAILSHYNFMIFLFLGTGAGMLWIEAKAYKKNNMEKERKTTRFLGWANIALGVILLGSSLVTGMS